MRKPLTGEPCAGEPHARFGGRGGLASFSTPIMLAYPWYSWIAASLTLLSMNRSRPAVIARPQAVAIHGRAPWYSWIAASLALLAMTDLWFMVRMQFRPPETGNSQ